MQNNFGRIQHMDMKKIYSLMLIVWCCLVAFSCVNAGALDDEESRIGGVGQIRQSESDDSLVVEYDKKTGSFTVVDVEGGRTWRSLSGESADKDIQVDYKIEGREVVVELKANPEKPLRALDFPRPFAAERGDRILLTQGNGFLFPAEMTDLGTDLIDYSHYPSRDMEMGCFGHFSGKTGYLAIIETPEDCGQSYKIGENGLRQPNVVWNGQWKKFGYTRRIRFVFFREATPMKMALRYREEMKRKGYYKLFGEKMKEKPYIQNYISNPHAKKIYQCW